MSRPPAVPFSVPSSDGTSPIALVTKRVNYIGLYSVMPFSSFCGVALGAVVDRSIRTPTSWVSPSTPQRIDQTEEDRLVGIPPQQPIDQLAARPHDLARQPHKRIHKGLELQS